MQYALHAPLIGSTVVQQQILHVCSVDTSLVDTSLVDTSLVDTCVHKNFDHKRIMEYVFKF